MKLKPGNRSRALFYDAPELSLALHRLGNAGNHDEALVMDAAGLVLDMLDRGGCWEVKRWEGGAIEVRQVAR